MKELILKNKTISIVIALLIVIGIIWLFSGSKSGKSDGSARSLAKCIKEKGAKFYGASWCPHCNNQKATFGDAASLLPYVECSEGGTKNQKQVCTDAGVKGYPLWKFADGKTQSGEMTLEQLKRASGC